MVGSCIILNNKYATNGESIMVLSQVLTFRVSNETLDHMKKIQKRLVSENFGRPAPYGYILQLALEKSGLIINDYDDYDEDEQE